MKLSLLYTLPVSARPCGVKSGRSLLTGSCARPPSSSLTCCCRARAAGCRATLRGFWPDTELIGTSSSLTHMKHTTCSFQITHKVRIKDLFLTICVLNLAMCTLFHKLKTILSYFMFL